MQFHSPAGVLRITDAQWQSVTRIKIPRQGFLCLRVSAESGPPLKLISLPFPSYEWLKELVGSILVTIVRVRGFQNI